MMTRGTDTMTLLFSSHDLIKSEVKFTAAQTEKVSRVSDSSTLKTHSIELRLGDPPDYDS